MIICALLAYALAFISGVLTSVPAAIDVERFADSWFTQTGFPLLTVTETVSEVPSGGLIIRQDRFLETGLADGDANVLWHVPVVLWHVPPGGATYTTTKILLTERETVVPCDLHFPYKLNFGNHGFCEYTELGRATCRC